MESNSINPFDKIEESQKKGIEELKAFIEEKLAELRKPPPKYLHSIQELADFLHCSKSTAIKYKKQNLFPYQQIGRKLTINSDLVIESLMNNKPKNRK